MCNIYKTAYYATGCLNRFNKTDNNYITTAKPEF